MKTTKTLYTFLFSFLFFHASAQVDDRDNIVSLSPHIGVPLNEIKNTNGLALGGHLQYEKNLASKTRLLFHFSGSMMQGKEYDTGFGYKDTYPAVAVLQLRAGFKYFPAGGLYVAGLAGVAQGTYQNESAKGYSFAPVVGYEFGNMRYYNVSIRYDASVFKGYKINTACFSIGYHL